jgi:hypothetical protein
MCCTEFLISLTTFSTISSISLLIYLTRLEKVDDKPSRTKALHVYVSWKIQNVRKELLKKTTKEEEKDGKKEEQKAEEKEH